jgi:hypothetical protein
MLVRRWSPEALHVVACSDALLLRISGLRAKSLSFVKETVTIIMIAKGNSRLQEN